MLVLPMLFAIFACEKSDSDLDRNFAVAYAELRIAEREYGETENGKVVRFEILQRYDMDADIFEEKINEIKNKPEKWQKFQNMFIVILDSIENSINAELDSIAKSTETEGKI